LFGSVTKPVSMYHIRMKTSDFDYELPEELIAQEARPRGESSLLVLQRQEGLIHHHGFPEILHYLHGGDLLVLNDTEVIPARIFARRRTGRRFEIFLLKRKAPAGEVWQALLRPGGRARQGEVLVLDDGGEVLLKEKLQEGQWLIGFSPPLELNRLGKIGQAPLPPYIRRPGGATRADQLRYQTVYASRPGAVAAPTAGLHFDQALLDRIHLRGIEVVRVTLHVGMGTFRPVTEEDPRRHTMHDEEYGFTEPGAAAVNLALEEGRRIVCVGTTSVRALEDALIKGGGRVQPGWTSTRIFIYPGFEFRGTGALLTNFHLPKSTLLMLVSAFAGREQVLKAYREAVSRAYRFYSYGDAMLIV